MTKETETQAANQAATESTTEDSPEALEQIFSDVVKGSLPPEGATDKPASESSAVTETTEEEETPAAGQETDKPPVSKPESETHQPQADEKDREIERLTNQLNGIRPRYEALQKEQRERAAREKAQPAGAPKPAMTDEEKAQAKEFGELGEMVVALSEQVDTLKKENGELKQQTAGFDDIRTEVEERKAREAKAEQDRAEKAQEDRLAEFHPDWKEVTTSKGFQEFAAKLPAAEREELANTDNPRVYASYLTDYKKTLNTGASVTDIQSQREKRLKNATTPSGRSSAPQDSDPSDTEAIFKKVFNESIRQQGGLG